MSYEVFCIFKKEWTIELLYFDIQQNSILYNQMDVVNFNLVVFNCKTIFLKELVCIFTLCYNISY